jgi:hypothetical protein
MDSRISNKMNNQKILELIVDGDIDEALEALIKLTKPMNNQDLINNCLQFQSQYNTYKKNEQLGLLDNPTAERNRITNALIFFISELKTIETKGEIKLKSDKKMVAKTFLNEGNIHAVFSDGTTKQLTFNRSDEMPVLSRKRGVVIFVRNVRNYRQHNFKEIWQVDVDSLIETLIKKRKPYQDGLDGEVDLYEVGNLSLSLDEDEIYFTCEKWATSSALTRVHLDTKEWITVGSAGFFKVVSFNNQECLLVSKMLIRDRGRDAYWMLIDRNDVVLKEFSDMVNAFRFLDMI